MSDFNNDSGQSLPPPGQPFLPPTQPQYTPSLATPNYSGTDTAELVAEPSSGPKRSRGKMFGALAGVVALVGAGTFAVTQIASNDSDGGAANPTEVGTKLVAALDGEDLLGVVDLLLPGERETLRQPLVDLSSELGRLEITENAVDLNKVPGFDITIADPKITSDSTNVDDIADVHVVGTASVDVDGKKVPIGKLLIDRVFGGDRPDMDASEDDRDFDIRFAAVQDGGRWYLSLFYTAAETARGDQDIPDKGITPVGADSPEGALDNLIKAGTDFDLEGVIAGLNPDEMAALQRYAPLFIDDAQSMVDDTDLKITVTDATYSVTGSGSTRQVGITSLTAKAKTAVHDAKIVFADGCVTATVDEDSVDTCAGDESVDGSLDSALGNLDLANTPELKKFVDDLRSSFGNFDMHGIVVDKVGGKWFVSPIGTTSEFFLSVLRALDRDEIDTLINDGGDAINSVFDGLFTDAVDTFPTDDTTYDTTYDTYPTYDTTYDTFPTDDTATDVTSSTDDSTATTDDTSYWFDCVYGGATEEVGACIQAGVDKGDFAKDDVPAPFLYPQCGLFDYYAGSDLYGDSAEAYHAIVDPNVKCIVDAASADGIDLSYSSPEFASPDCFAGLNPYNFSGDSGASSAAYTCAATGG